MSTEPPESQDLDSRQKIAQQVFDTVIKANEHQDNKANRIISSIAFLLAASSAVLAFSLPSSATGGRFRGLFSPDYLFGSHPALLSFAFFVILVLAGVIFYLNALGPSFNWNSNREPQNLNKEKSTLLFFEEVGKHDVDSFKKHITASDIDALKRQLIGNFAAESVLISQKLKGKVAFMSFGSVMFRFGVPWLIPMVFSNYSTEAGITLLTYIVAVAIPLLATGWFSFKPHQINKGGGSTWLTYFLIGGILILIGVIQYLIGWWRP